MLCVTSWRLKLHLKVDMPGMCAEMVFIQFEWDVAARKQGCEDVIFPPRNPTSHYQRLLKRYISCTCDYTPTINTLGDGTCSSNKDTADLGDVPSIPRCQVSRGENHIWQFPGQSRLWLVPAYLATFPTTSWQIPPDQRDTSALDDFGMFVIASSACLRATKAARTGKARPVKLTDSFEIN